MGKDQAVSDLTVTEYVRSDRGGAGGAEGVVDSTLSATTASRTSSSLSFLHFKRFFLQRQHQQNASVLLALRTHARGLLRDPTQPRAAQGERRGAEKRKGEIFCGAHGRALLVRLCGEMCFWRTAVAAWGSPKIGLRLWFGGSLNE